MGLVSHEEPSPGVYYYLTDPASAASIAERGLRKSGIWNPLSTISLIDRLPPHTGGGVLRLVLTPEQSAQVERLEASDHGQGYRRFLVPMGLLRDAYIARVIGGSPE